MLLSIKAKNRHEASLIPCPHTEYLSYLLSVRGCLSVLAVMCVWSVVGIRGWCHIWWHRWLQSRQRLSSNLFPLLLCTNAHTNTHTHAHTVKWKVNFLPHHWSAQETWIDWFDSVLLQAEGEKEGAGNREKRKEEREKVDRADDCANHLYDQAIIY